ncbi:MAG: 2-C-methyl-D-erythritol 4-phosphate cytidylyltransferase [Lentimonas sp.]
MSTTALFLAAGSGSRMQGSVDDKVLTLLNGTPVFIHSIQAFLQSKVADRFTIVHRDEPQRIALEEALKSIDIGTTLISWVTGGKERQDSVLNALIQQEASCKYVFIHDCARPLITAEAIQALHAALQRNNAVVLAHPVMDTIKRIPTNDTIEKVMLEDLDRNRLWAMETPQAFDYADILSAYQNVKANKLAITDDTAAAATIGIHTTLVPNTKPNLKITTPQDLLYAEWLLQQSTR